jgi:hypothetical protein
VKIQSTNNNASTIDLISYYFFPANQHINKHEVAFQAALPWRDANVPHETGGLQNRQYHGRRTGKTVRV